MDCSKVGQLILALRKEKGMTQKQLADAMMLSDRTISKWERGLGCPDVSLLAALSGILQVDLARMLAGDLRPNEKDGGNMKKTKFYYCPDCGNLLFGTGQAEVSCCGRTRAPLIPQPEDAQHCIHMEEIDGEYYLTLQHDMTKQHYLTFAAYVCADKVFMVKLYPEQSAAARLPKMFGGCWYVCCNRHGLFEKKG